MKKCFALKDCQTLKHKDLFYLGTLDKTGIFFHIPEYQEILILSKFSIFWNNQSSIIVARKMQVY